MEGKSAEQLPGTGWGETDRKREQSHGAARDGGDWLI